MWKSPKPDTLNPTAANDPSKRSPFAFNAGLDPAHDNYAVVIVDRIFKAAIEAQATDVHIELNREQTLLRWRVDGTLVDLGSVPNGRSTSILNRIKALARLVTYRCDIPQEGRMMLADYQVEARVGTLPTLHGERAVIRLALAQKKLLNLHELGMADEVLEDLRLATSATSGVILITGPAGAGKTTTAYACLKELICQDTFQQRSLVTLEDPVEIEFPGVAQSQINPLVGYDWASGLKALFRQDPEVMLVGEIRDAATAAVVFEAAMTGQLVITTMHARSAADAIRRLLDMQIQPHHLLSGLNLLVCQRLLKSTCECQTANEHFDHAEKNAASNTANNALRKALPLNEAVCPICSGCGYTGRILLTESFPRIERELAKAIMSDADSKCLESLAQGAGMVTLSQQATNAVQAHRTTLAELRRHFTQ